MKDIGVFQEHFTSEISNLSKKLNKFSEDRDFVEVLQSLYEDLQKRDFHVSLEDFFKVFTILMVEKINGPKTPEQDIVLNPLYRSMKECAAGDDVCILLEGR